MRLIEELLFVWVVIVGFALMIMSDMFNVSYLGIIWLVIALSLFVTYIIACIREAITDIKNWYLNRKCK